MQTTNHSLLLKRRGNSSCIDETDRDECDDACLEGGAEHTSRMEAGSEFGKEFVLSFPLGTCEGIWKIMGLGWGSVGPFSTIIFWTKKLRTYILIGFDKFIGISTSQKRNTHFPWPFFSPDETAATLYLVLIHGGFHFEWNPKMFGAQEMQWFIHF